jgi:hypothetical protein
MMAMKKLFPMLGTLALLFFQSLEKVRAESAAALFARGDVPAYKIALDSWLDTTERAAGTDAAARWPKLVATPGKPARVAITAAQADGRVAIEGVGFARVSE